MPSGPSASGNPPHGVPSNATSNFNSVPQTTVGPTRRFNVFLKKVFEYFYLLTFLLINLKRLIIYDFKPIGLMYFFKRVLEYFCLLTFL